MQQTTLFSGVDAAQTQLDRSFKSGARRQEELLSHVEHNEIRDLLVEHTGLGFRSGSRGLVVVTHVPETVDKCDVQTFNLHRHALSQMCSKVKLPLTYLDHLTSQGLWGETLACENLEALFEKTEFRKQDNAPAKFLLRTVNNSVRGFLSRRYALHLSTNPLIHRFVDYCKEFDCRPIAANWGDLRVQLQCALPYIFQPFKDQHIAIGMSFFNSDFGAGTFSVFPSILDADRDLHMTLGEYSMGVTMDKELFKKIHLGPSLNETDLNRVNDGRGKRTDEVCAQMRINMQKRLSREFCQTVCSAIKKAQNTDTSWVVVKRSLGELLKEEIEILERMLMERSLKLPQLKVDSDGLPIPTMWWAAQAVSHLAKGSGDPDRRIELQNHAGKFITKGD